MFAYVLALVSHPADTRRLPAMRGRDQTMTTINANGLTVIALADLDAALAADIAGDPASDLVAYEAAYDGATVSNQRWHIVHSAEACRGGIVLVGSGASGSTSWTDAATPEEVLERLLAGELRG